MKINENASFKFMNIFKGFNSFPHENYLGFFRHGTKQKNVSEFSIVSWICCSHFKRLKSASTLLLVSSITYALYCLYFLKMFQCPMSLFILLTVCDLFSNKIRSTKSSLFSIQLLDTLYKNVMLVF